MLYLTKFLYKTFLLPPGIFIILLLAIGIWLYRRERKAAIALISITAILYILSTPIVGSLLIKSLERQYRPPASVKGDVIVMLGGGSFAGTPDIDGAGGLTGSSANRLLTAARIHKETGLPIIISAGKLYSESGNEANIAKRKLAGLGIPVDKVIAEDKSRNTYENAKYTLKILKTRHFKKPILVTSAYHMRRSVMNFKKLGVSVEPYPTDYRSDINPSVHLNSFAPCYDGFANSGMAIREYIGILALAL